MNYMVFFLTIIILGIPSWRYYLPEKLWYSINKKIKYNYNVLMWLLIMTIVLVLLNFLLTTLAISEEAQKVIVSIYSGIFIVLAPRKELNQGGIIGLFIKRPK